MPDGTVVQGQRRPQRRSPEAGVCPVCPARCVCHVCPVRHMHPVCPVCRMRRVRCVCAGPWAAPEAE